MLIPKNRFYLMWIMAVVVLVITGTCEIVRADNSYSNLVLDKITEVKNSYTGKTVYIYYITKKLPGCEYFRITKYSDKKYSLTVMVLHPYNKCRRYLELNDKTYFRIGNKSYDNNISTFVRGIYIARLNKTIMSLIANAGYIKVTLNFYGYPEYIPLHIGFRNNLKELVKRDIK